MVKLHKGKIQEMKLFRPLSLVPKFCVSASALDVGRDFNELRRFVAFPLQKIKKKKLVKV